MSPEPVTLVKDVAPHRDFFQAQFLLLVASGGLTNVTVDTSLVDYEGRVWMTGPRATLSVRVLDEPGISKQTSASIPGPSGPSSRPTINIGGPSAMQPRY
jgi:integrator complex subunit 7